MFMGKIANEFNIKREAHPDLSDETVALLLVAEKLDVIANKASVLDPDQLTQLKDKMDEIATTVHGVGQMVGNLHQ